jgi:hypothetical protein
LAANSKNGKIYKISKDVDQWNFMSIKYFHRMKIYSFLFIFNTVKIFTYI